jgi:hypothetical protein
MWVGDDMKKLLIVLLFLCCLVTASFSQTQAVIREISGKVEIQPPQSSWIAAQEGTVVSLGTTISTGFSSRAVIDLGRSVLRVDPLTRLRIDQLIEREGTVSTDLFLRVGKVNAEVKSASGVTQDFKLRSPVSTAAVRGTGFDYSGYDLYVYDGQVTYENLTGQNRTYGVGESGETSGTDTPESGQRIKDTDSGVNPYTTGVGGAPREAPSGTSGLGLTGSVIIEVVIPQ